MDERLPLPSVPAECRYNASRIARVSAPVAARNNCTNSVFTAPRAHLMTAFDMADRDTTKQTSQTLPMRGIFAGKYRVNLGGDDTT